MSKCKKIKKELVAFIYDELAVNERRRVELHLQACPSCRKDLHKITQAMAPVDNISSDIQKVMDSMDWGNISVEITNRVFEQEKNGALRMERKKWISNLLDSRFRPVYAALLLGLMLGSFLTYVALRKSRSFQEAGAKIIMPAGFLDRVELELARKETLDYLEKSQYLILEIVRSPESSGMTASHGTTQRVQDLLSKKKYINQQLDHFEMVKAKEICDQIEMLFYELSRISEDLPQEELERIQSLIRDRQILLKIKILKEELQESEV
ncbi:MAG: zf-HC2 domain-containing protein [Candidatus Aminicenantes bacterium]|nr:zf-HC2 domain-containing protein [Candidatus Aminicenantes bacterium]